MMLSCAPMTSQRDGAQALHEAVRRPKNVEVLRLLLDKGADPTLSGRELPMPALAKAAEVGCPRNLGVLMESLEAQGKLDALLDLRTQLGGLAHGAGAATYCPVEHACAEVSLCSQS